jgi:hypothetical protein
LCGSIGKRTSMSQNERWIRLITVNLGIELEPLTELAS